MPLNRHSGESWNPGILALWNTNPYLSSLDSGLRRNDGLRWNNSSRLNSYDFVGFAGYCRYKG